MSTEINTRGLIRAKISGFPAGDDAECMTKAEILATGLALVNGQYIDNECPMIDDVIGNVTTTRYDFYGTPSQLDFSDSPRMQTSRVTSRKVTVINGVDQSPAIYMGWRVKSYTNAGAWNVSKDGDNLNCSSRIAILEGTDSVVTLEMLNDTSKTTTVYLYSQPL